MLIKYADNKQLNVAVGDLVSIQGNYGRVVDVHHGRSQYHNNQAYVDVRVKFINELKDTYYDNEWYGLFYIIEKGGT